ncbi:hypothetical protein BRADI_5g10904v3 [Brachypodium distachyon]|uniref:CCHC-type domain-containing protein n=1 Tax=Brachypodium distachyon TaxID=15368 RepID=A0A0Q3E4Z9_BRADI|nr:hypothetical protein BRADI_5g10904v3 [Brachypodium distachyon]
MATVGDSGGAVPVPPTCSFAEAVMQQGGDWRGGERGGPGGRGRGGLGGWDGAWRGQPQPPGPMPYQLEQFGGDGFGQGIPGQALHPDPRGAAYGTFPPPEFHGYQGASYVGNPQTGGFVGHGGPGGGVQSIPQFSGFGGGRGNSDGFGRGNFNQQQGPARSADSVDSAQASNGYVQSGVGGNAQGMSDAGSGQIGRGTVNTSVPILPNSKICYRCDGAGHGVKEWKTILFCDICAKDSHLTSKCERSSMSQRGGECDQF